MSVNYKLNLKDNSWIKFKNIYRLIHRLNLKIFIELIHRLNLKNKFKS